MNRGVVSKSPTTHCCLCISEEVVVLNEGTELFAHRLECVGLGNSLRPLHRRAAQKS